MNNKYRIGSIYYNDDKQFYLLVTDKTEKEVMGYTSKWCNPDSRDRFHLLHTEKIGTFNFGGLNIAFGNIFRGSILDKNLNLRYVRSLQKCEMKAFRMIMEMIIERKIVYKDANGRTRAIR